MNSFYHVIFYITIGVCNIYVFVIASLQSNFTIAGEFECLIRQINHALPMDNLNQQFQLINTDKFRIIPELLVVVQLLVLLKMLFGLDDTTERYQSEFARLVNREMKKEFDKVEDWSELFVIEDWLGYLMRRRELVKREISCTRMFNSNASISMAKLNELLETSSISGNYVLLASSLSSYYNLL